MSTPTVTQQVQQALNTDGSWMGRQALLKQCPAAADGDALASVLVTLSQAGKIQRRTGVMGLEYAALDVSGDASASLPEDAPNHPVTDEPEPPLKSSRISDAMREKIVAAFKTRTSLTNADLRSLIDRSQPIVSKFLRELLDAGLIEKSGNGRATEFSWVGSADLPPEKVSGALIDDVDLATLAATQASHVAAPPVDDCTLKCALWSTGEFQIQRGRESLVLQPEETRRLFQFINAVELD